MRISSARSPLLIAGIWMAVLASTSAFAQLPMPASGNDEADAFLPSSTIPEAGSYVLTDPVCPPRDFSGTDDDMIHVRADYDAAGDEWVHTIHGDPGAAPCGDAVFIFDGSDPIIDNELGTAAINTDRSFGPVHLQHAQVDVGDLESVWVFAYADGDFSTGIPILRDTIAPLLRLHEGRLPHADRFNPFRIYRAEDHVNVLLRAHDMSHLAPSDSALSDLLEITADFSHLDERVTLPPELGGDSIHAVPFVSLGYDFVDNDGDWVPNDPLIDLNDDGVMDFPEPYVDENADGSFTPGETFVDVNGNDIYDGPGGSGHSYDMNLDSTDPHEHGWYEIRLLAPGDGDRHQDVVKGFRVLDPVTDPNGIENFGEIQDIPVPIRIVDPDFDAVTEYGAATPVFACEMDEVPPTISRVTELYALPALEAPSNPADNLIVPYDPTYALARYFNFKAETPSDADVLFGVAQVRRAGEVWRDLSLDPPGWHVGPGVPGIAGYDDDGDASDLIDADEDGIAAGDGHDLRDAEVVDALQDSLADAEAVGGDGLYRTTDRRDNDNDAFFVFEPYHDADGLLGGATLTQRLRWFNLDESTSNDADDDDDGLVDESDELEAYEVQADDNEDGLLDAEGVVLLLDGARLTGAFDPNYSGPIFVAATSVLGAHPADGDGDLRALTEFIPGGQAVLDPAGVGAQGSLPNLRWGDDTVAMEFGWFSLHGERNVDFWHAAQIHFGEVPDGNTTYELRMLAFDQPGNMSAEYAVPISFTSDVAAPFVEITGCSDGDPLTGPADFVDVLPERGGLQIHDQQTYTLTSENLEGINRVLYEQRASANAGASWSAWELLAETTTPPFDCDWFADMVDNAPPDDSLLVQFRAYGEDLFGNLQDPDSACVFQATVVDGSPPITWFLQLDDVVNPNDDPLLGPDYFLWEHGIVTLPVGPAVDFVANFDDGDSDPSSNDVLSVSFDIRLRGYPDAWQVLGTVTGEVITDPETGHPLYVDLVAPVTLTFDSTPTPRGAYVLRARACDYEGNPTLAGADLAEVLVSANPPRAYIEQPVPAAAGGRAQFSVHAFCYSECTGVDRVAFQCYEDTDANGLDDDGQEWITFAIDDGSAPDPRGDVVLRRGTDPYFALSGHVAFTPLGGVGGEGFVDHAADGYGDLDPIVREAEGGTYGIYDVGIDSLLTGDASRVPDGSPLSPFEPSCHFHTTSEGAGFEAHAWVCQDNVLQGCNDELDQWRAEWNADGLTGSYLLRAVAVDYSGAVDDTASTPSIIPTVHVQLTASETPELTVLPRALALGRVAPNPSGQQMQIDYAVPEDTALELTIHDVQGRAVGTLIDGIVPGGYHEITWHGTDARGRPVAAGPYWIRLRAGEEVVTRKIILLR